MSSAAPAPGAAPLEKAPSDKDPLLRLAKHLPEAQDREWYGALISYIHTLQPGDELVKIAQLFGFLTLMNQKLPEALADKHAELRDMLLKAHAAFQKQVETNASYHAELHKRLSQLPAEIADGVKPDAMVKAMTESFRQQIQKTGLQETQALLSAAVGDLMTTAQTFDAAVKPLTTRYNDLAHRVETQAASLVTQSNNLARTADTIRQKNAALVAEMRNMNWIWIATVGVVVLLVGLFGGVTWEQRRVGNLVVHLQNQMAQLQQAVQTPAPPAAEPAGKHLRKK